MSQPESSSKGPRWTSVSIALFVIGLLIVIPAALCTLVVAAEEGDDPDVIMLILAFGGVPVAAGVAFIYAALKIRPRAELAGGLSAPGNTAPHWTGPSIALFVLGLVILLPSGLCTVLLGGAAVAEGLAAADLGALFMMLLAGGVPAAVGAALVYAALKVRRRN